MLKCFNCGAIFEYPKLVREYRGEFWGSPAYETVGYCPCCGDDAIDEYHSYDDEDDEDEEEE